MSQFKVGKTYQVRSICDWDCVFSFKVKSRSAKFIEIEDVHGHPKRVCVKSVGGIEKAKPLGTYSMCPVISADRELV
jgi:hypothetical protein